MRLQSFLLCEVCLFPCESSLGREKSLSPRGSRELVKFSFLKQRNRLAALLKTVCTIGCLIWLRKGLFELAFSWPLKGRESRAKPWPGFWTTSGTDHFGRQTSWNWDTSWVGSLAQLYSIFQCSCSKFNILISKIHLSKGWKIIFSADDHAINPSGVSAPTIKWTA